MRARPDKPHGVPAAYGDVIRVSNTVAEARFVHVDDGLRGRAEAHLRRWAAEDRWELRIESGLHEAAPPDHPHSRTFRCDHCGDRSYLAAFAAGHALGSPYRHTRCHVCGEGRRMPA
jgi:hypothetical protein